MILRELVRYYDRKAIDPDPAQRLPSAGLEDKEIPFLIELAADGRVLQLIRNGISLSSSPALGRRCAGSGSIALRS